MTEQLSTPNDEPSVEDMAREFVQRNMNVWSNLQLDQEVLCRSMVAHAAIMLTARCGANQVARDLRELADQLELGNMPAAGRG